MTDHLEPDTITLPGQNYALINVVSPTSNQKNESCAMKIKGVFEKIEDAKEYAQKLNKIDPTFDLYLVEMYKWLPIPPNNDDIESQEYQDKRLNNIIQSHKEEQLKARQFFEERKSDLMEGKLEPNDVMTHNNLKVEELKVQEENPTVEETQEKSE